MDDDSDDFADLPEPQPLYSHPTWFYRVVAVCCVVATVAALIAALR